jgi:3-oxoacyl-(acyl-carrier-protein) synthase
LQTPSDLSVALFWVGYGATAPQVVHVSVCFDVQGPYLVTYPGAAQFYLALEEAVAALAEDRVDAAIVGGVAHQRNFLVEHHFARVVPPVSKDDLRDAAAVLVLERASSARARGATARARLASFTLAYTPFDALEEMPGAYDSAEEAGDLGAASVPAAVARAIGNGTDASHRTTSRDGLAGESTWRVRGIT